MTPLYIFDLDGTLALIDHRRHLVEGETKDWPAFFRACMLTIARTDPYTDIHHKGDLYMERAWLLSKFSIDEFAGVRIHRIARSDIDRHLHDHPGWSLSIVLRGGYFEELPLEPRADLARWTDGQEQTYQVWRAPGDVVYREAADRHRIVIPEGQESLSLFVIGPTVHKWGFYTEAGKVAWGQYEGEAKGRVK